MSGGNSFRLSSLVRNCIYHPAVSQTKQIHAQILVRGFLSDVTLQTDLLLLYSKCGFLCDARQVFDRMVDRNMHSWNILIFWYVQNSKFSDALSVFDRFRQMDLRPDHYTFPPLFKACGGVVGYTYLGKLLYGWVIKLGYGGYVVVTSSSLGMWDSVSLIRLKMKDLGLVKTPGCSWIMISGKIHKFYQGDNSHPLAVLVCKTLERITKAKLLSGECGVEEYV
ncbi:hypothetical protein FEM48_Zijuj08G0200100 [Ziziphus jujuba var. spinosa]|uniref:Pentatricopeptide repeat-containing protein n=1 Tax=Ziziphus jujuba var. spinosa TaxID=714518 RepID=A0A978V134_ZIZJJ|nr:hypothetical protein FEM48_Zijuj08G0200100 [Ziziphus jujuba var. spinosa]